MTAGSTIKTRDMVYIALFTVLTAICSWISIPTVVPFTLQTFAVFFTCLVLEEKEGPVRYLFIFYLELSEFLFFLTLPAESVHCWGRQEDTLSDCFLVR